MCHLPPVRVEDGAGPVTYLEYQACSALLGTEVMVFLEHARQVLCHGHIPKLLTLVPGVFFKNFFYLKGP